ncbi:MAG: flagellar motor switch protein FliM [Candidatus Zixiibacteriota bacterium]|nr:MAG: flagellar motor switch protein FliM [candidate division Zixibacteria bacterium]
MAKILTQGEIDALLTTVSSGRPEREPAALPDEQSGHTVVKYDFKHPNRVSKDQVRTLENMHDNFAGHASQTLSAMLRTMVDVDLVSVDQINYSEYIMSLVTPSCSYTFSAKPLDGLCIIDFNPTLVFAFIDRIFGGADKTLEIERELTGIERAVLTKITRKLYRDMEKSWENITPITTEEKSFETNPQFMQIIPTGETVIVVSFQLKLFKSTGLVTICYPYVSLEPVMAKLSAQNWIDATKKRSIEEGVEQNRENIQDIKVDLDLILARTRLRMKDFLNLKVGDVIATDTQINEAAELLVAGRKKFLCRPGLFGKRKAGQVTDVHPVIYKE